MTKLAIWQGISLAISKRRQENEAALAACTQDDVRPILLRIKADDERRARLAGEWIAYHS